MLITIVKSIIIRNVRNKTVKDGEKTTAMSGRREIEKVSEETNSDRTTIATEVNLGMKSDSNLKETTDKCTEDTYELSG